MASITIEPDGPFPASLEISKWSGSFVGTESTLHQLSPYIGKLKSGMVTELISRSTEPGDWILDPFAGSGTVPLQGWIMGRNVIANDLNPYAQVLLRAKLGRTPSLDSELNKIRKLGRSVLGRIKSHPVRSAPPFVSSFFHPDTLQEALHWTALLQGGEEHFLLACLMGILHHQRPGFLSYPSSHAVPYLREAKFPQDKFPELYQYRSVQERLERKVQRALKRVPELDHTLKRRVLMQDSNSLVAGHRADAIITSPPYMRRLSYARDNRLRLWFLGQNEHKELDRLLSPPVSGFTETLQSWLTSWHKILKPGGRCVLVVGDETLGNGNARLPEAILALVSAKLVNYDLVDHIVDGIPDERRVRRAASGSKSEVIIVLRRC